MWRLAEPGDDDALVEMCLRLYDEDPGILPIHSENMRSTLWALRRKPFCGRAVVLEIESEIAGYALLIAFWSNELGGDICEVDELFVVPERRNLGHGKSLFEAILQGSLWPTPIVGMALGVTPDNVRARRFYERLGFRAVGISMVRSSIITPHGAKQPPVPYRGALFRIWRISPRRQWSPAPTGFDQSDQHPFWPH